MCAYISLSLYIYIYIHVYTYVYKYIYIERERDSVRARPAHRASTSGISPRAADAGHARTPELYHRRLPGRHTGPPSTTSAQGCPMVANRRTRPGRLHAHFGRRPLHPSPPGGL